MLRLTLRRRSRVTYPLTPVRLRRSPGAQPEAPSLACPEPVEGPPKRPNRTPRPLSENPPNEDLFGKTTKHRIRPAQNDQTLP